MTTNTKTDGREFNQGVPYGHAREYSRTPAVVSPNGSLSNHHWVKAGHDSPGVKAGDWLIGERVTEVEATHFLCHGLTVIPTNHEGEE